MYDESRSVPFAVALYAGAVIQLAFAYWSAEARWILVGAAVLLIFLARVASRYEIHFDGDTLRFGFRHWSKTLRLGEIHAARMEHVGLWTFGGVGWRLRPKKIGYVRWFGPAIAVVTDGREYWLSCEHPQRLLDALRHAGVQIV